MALELIEEAAGDIRNARYLALASDLAYLSQAEAGPRFQSELGLDAKLFGVGNTQAYVASGPNAVVVAFRGTEAPTSIEGLKDWLLSDALNLLILPSGRLGTDLVGAGVGARFHQGFVNALADIWEPVSEATAAELKKEDRPLWITGHSLGGAIALLSGWMFLRKFVPVHQVVTFGAPMVGNPAACQGFDRELTDKVYRYANHLDPIPKLPTMSLVANEYSHALKEMMLGQAPATGGMGDLFQGMVSRAANGLLDTTLADEVWHYVTERLEAHSLVKYTSALNEDKA
jgi:triacylglycerol lipase